MKLCHGLSVPPQLWLWSIGGVPEGVPGGRSGQLQFALLGVAVGLLAACSAVAEDMQSTTDMAAVKAKAALCMALHELHRSRPSRSKSEIESEIPDLKKLFFEFYEGQRVAADSLYPNTFRTGQVGPLPTFEIVQVVGENEMHAMIGSGRFIIRGVSTADFADGQTCRSSRFWHVCGTESYETVSGGSKKVYVLQLAENQMLKVQPTRSYPWYDTKNKVLVVGELKAIDGSKVVFLSAGEEKTFPLSKFAAGDRDLLRVLWDRYGDSRPRPK
jgi:hypothetical protein